jgi:ribosomal-protein-alanine N-acetyltransferase
MDIELRKWSFNDAEELAKAINNKNVIKWLRDGLPSPYSASDAVDYIKSTMEADPNDLFAFAIVANGNVVGSISALRQGNIHRLSAEMGYFIAEPYWGKGYATMAVKKLTDFIFSNTDIIRIFAMPFSDNEGSKRVLEKCGFNLEGLLAKNAVKDGVIKDILLYALIKNS